jgi:dipeptidyl aminopeptidase/acylaminoacyl peptidase
LRTIFLQRCGRIDREYNRHWKHKGIYFFSPGATPEGDPPFVGVMPVGGGAEQVLWRSPKQMYAEPMALLAGDQVLVRQESQSMSPNYFVATLPQRTDGVAPKQVTDFPSPYANLKVPTKQLLKYQRADGLELTATLWLPAGYDKSQGPLPTLMEAYPAEFKTRAAAGQVSGSPFRFPRIGWGSPVFFTQTGRCAAGDDGKPRLALVPYIEEQMQFTRCRGVNSQYPLQGVNQIYLR